ncbi:MAG TPA: GDP-mannose 4,6-dehydratase [Myxococcales bacterium]|nr:GDP-mannose 4,6-dehydratase [Myxococcales bacterium]
MRVLVTGADGFVGKHLCRHFREQGDSVTEAHGPPGRGASSGGMPLDVTDPANVRAVLDAARPEVIVHLAGLSSVANSHQEPSRAFAVNALGTVNLLAAASAAAPKARILLIGSAEMYGTLPAGARATEDFPLRPVSPYAASKVSAEVAGLQFNRATSLEVVAVRPFNHIGTGQAPQFVVPSFARQVEAIRTGRSPATLKVGDLTVTRDFSHVDDVVRAYRLLALQGRPGEAYNVCSGEGRTIRSLLDELLEMAGVTAAVEVDQLRLRQAEIPSLVGDSAKLRKLGWQPSRTVRDALRDVLQEARAAAGTGG